MIKIFAPPLDTMWRLTEDWTLPGRILQNSDNNDTTGIDLHPWHWPEFGGREANHPRGWWDETGRRARYDAWVESQAITIAAGTIIVFDRYHASHSGAEQITLRILISPDTRYNPKKLGGKMKGRGRLYVDLVSLNTLPPVEEVESLA